MSIGQRIDMPHDKACQFGGNWSNDSNAGVFALNLNNIRTNSNNNVGGRDCGVQPDMPKSNTGPRGMRCPAVSEIKQPAFSSNAVERQGRRKRYGNLFEDAFTMDKLYVAYLEARKSKRNKNPVLAFEASLGSELKALYDELHSGTYTPGEYSFFYVYEPKKRIIRAPKFRDLVVQHAMYREIYDIFNPSFVDQSFACRKNGGTHKASEYTQKQMRKHSGESYYLKMDVRKFFYSINRAILERLFRRKIKDERFVQLMVEFSKMETDTGVPIGSLLSQIYALIYLNPLDHFIKRVLKVRSYVRYVDDFLMIGLGLKQAKRLKLQCERFLADVLDLKVSHWTMQKVKRGINFVGYRTWKTYKLVRKHSMFKFKRAVKRLQIESIVSLIGHAIDTATMPLYKQILIDFGVIHTLPKRSIRCLNTINLFR